MTDHTTTWQRARLTGVLTALGLLLGAAGADAQQLCGDTDASRTVTVTDGVAILQAAAGLNDECDPAVCDFDVSGTITVTDGVTALRKAAALPIQSNCVPKRTFFDPGVTNVILSVQPFLDRVLTFVPQSGKPPQGDVIPCDNSFDDGVVEIAVDGAETTISFLGCELDGVLVDGDLIDGQGGIEVAITLTYLNDDTLDFSGFINGIDTGTSLNFGGFLEVSSGLSFPEISDFTMTIQQFKVGPTGSLLGGQVILDLRDAELQGFLEIDERYDGSNLVTMTITRDDSSRVTTLFDLITERFL